MPVYRPLPDDYDDEFDALLRYAFSIEDGPVPDDYERDRPELGERRGLFDGDDLLSVCRHYFFTARVRGEWSDLAGLSAVATPPEHRRRGYVRRMLAESLREYRDRDVHFSALWPFQHSFYRKFGWATSNRRARCECPPDALSFAAAADAGRFRRLTADDHDVVEPVHRVHREGVELTIDRTEDWWCHRVFEGRETDPYAYAWERDGEVRGYLVYGVDDGDEPTLEVHERAFLDAEADEHLLAFLHDHDSQVDRVRIPELAAAPLLDRVEEPQAIECTVEPGPMFRLVDVPTALDALSSPTERTGSVVFEVSDPLADWNDGQFVLSASSDGVTCDATDADPDVTVDVGTLSQLYVGYHSVADARRLDSLSLLNDDATALLRSLFPPRTVGLRDFF